MDEKKDTITIASEFDQMTDKDAILRTQNKECNNVDRIKTKLSHIRKQIEWKTIESIQDSTYKDTFKYIFHKFKKGIYVRIHDNQLIHYLPFNNENFVNEWNHLIKVDTTKYKDLSLFIRIMIPNLDLNPKN